MFTHKHKVGDLTVYSEGDLTKALDLTPKQKIAKDRAEEDLTDKAMVRDQTCWCYGCPRSAVQWVREVQFDTKAEKEGFDQVIVSTRDYSGPVPGFCAGHMVVGPGQLAEAVYHAREEFKWGAPANRWFTVFVDGTRAGGQIHELNLGPAYTVVEEYAPASH